MRTSPEPFEVRDGALFLEDLDLSELTVPLEGGGAAWLLGRRALERVLDADAAPRTLDLYEIGPPAVLSLVADHGWWARVRSRHELSVARAAGFPAEQLVAGGRALDDGFLKDALTEGVAALQLAHPDDRANAERIGQALGLTVPPAHGVPLPPPDDAFGGCGGLLVRVLRDPPDLAIDAPWPAGADVHVWGLQPGDVQAGRLAGLATLDDPAREPPAWIHGDVRRGDWVVIPAPGGLAATAGSTHPEPPRLLVSGSRWRPLDPRTGPPPIDL